MTIQDVINDFKDVSPMTVVGGIPAKIIKTVEDKSSQSFLVQGQDCGMEAQYETAV